VGGSGGGGGGGGGGSSDATTAVIFGLGNVAVDCARVLLKQPQHLVRCCNFNPGCPTWGSVSAIASKV